MSVQEFLALPDDGIHRELIHGRVREDRELWAGGKRGTEATVLNRFHNRIVIRVGQLLANWMDLQPKPRGEVVGGEARFWLRGTRESLVGIDISPHGRSGNAFSCAGAIRQSISAGLPCESRPLVRVTFSSEPAAPASVSCASLFRDTNPAAAFLRRIVQPPREGPVPSRSPGHGGSARPS
jgi:hypothetical protein